MSWLVAGTGKKIPGRRQAGFNVVLIASVHGDGDCGCRHPAPLSLAYAR